MYYVSAIVYPPLYYVSAIVGAAERRQILRSYALFWLENVKLTVLGVFGAAMHPCVLWLTPRSCAKFVFCLRTCVTKT